MALRGSLMIIFNGCRAANFVQIFFLAMSSVKERAKNNEAPNASPQIKDRKIARHYPVFHFSINFDGFLSTSFAPSTKKNEVINIQNFDANIEERSPRQVCQNLSNRNLLVALHP